MKVWTRLALLGSLSCATTTALAGGPSVVINEYLYDPAGDPTGDANQDTVVNTSEDEFVELVNVSGSAIDLGGWQIRDAVALRHVFPASTIVDAGCAIVVFGGGAPPPNFFNGAAVQVASTGFLGLTNNGDSIILEDAVLALVDTITYLDAGDVNQSYTRDPDLTGPFVQHTLATGSAGALFSPGSRINGTAFGACIPPGADFDGDGHPDSADNCPNIANPDQLDCNENGLGDICEIDADPLADCNDNGVLDSCESGDCNNNFIPDITDICVGISLDCNLNNIPDECEDDCNGNLVPDDCDIANKTSEDTNANGIPDECENLAGIIINEILADPPAGAAGDANGDTIPNDSQGANADEFLEIVNSGASPVNISGWTLSDGQSVRHVFPSGTIVQPNCGLVVFGGGTPIGQFGGMLKQTASSGTLSLNNAGDVITIRDTSNFIGAFASYGSEGGDDQSLTRFPDITGAFVKHTTAQPGVLFSPGRRFNLSTFGGCPPLLPDADGDGIPDANDNCVNAPNPLQEDCDEDGVGDECDNDPDGNGNGIPDNCEVGVPGNVRLNEIRVDQTGTDNDEYVEIKGPAGLSLNGLSIVIIGDVTNGNSGAVESSVSLQGGSIPADGHFLVVEPTHTLAPVAQRDLVTPTANGLNLENDDNLTVLLVTNYNGSNGQDLDADNNGVIDAPAPWTAIVDAVGILDVPLPPAAGEEWAYGASLGFVNIGPDTTPGAFDPGQVYRCEPARTWLFGRFNPADPAGGTDTAGLVNPDCPTPDCPGDRDNDGDVDIDDLLTIVNTWGTNSPLGDANNSGVVDIDDLLIIVNGWGQCPP